MIVNVKLVLGKNKEQVIDIYMEMLLWENGVHHTASTIQEKLAFPKVCVKARAKCHIC